jgi:hypothetical protein
VKILRDAGVKIKKITEILLIILDKELVLWLNVYFAERE